jgi:3-hydroxyanthranilate 3,4-dioxygenase
MVPPVSNKMIVEGSQMIAQIIAGGNTRMDFHDDPVEEFFYQLKGTMLLKVWEAGQFIDVPIREGEVFMLPAHVRHSPQRPDPDSLGLVLEGNRQAGDLDGFEWFCFECGQRVHRVEVVVANIVTDLPPLYDAFAENIDARTCNHCGTVHPGKGAPPKGWVVL